MYEKTKTYHDELEHSLLVFILFNTFWLFLVMLRECKATTKIIYKKVLCDMRWTGMVCDLINENSIVTYHAILVMNMYIQSHTLTHKQHKTLRKKLMWYRQMKFSLPFRSKYEIFII